jgi:exoribonuclease II
VEVFTLKEGCACPAVSLYLTLAPDYSVVAQESKLERVTICANLRHEQLEPLFNQATLGNGVDYRYRDELEWLWHFADHLEEKRGAKDKGRGLIPEYMFKIENDRVRITHRERGTPIDKVVAELMILANSRWADWLAENKVTAIYRAQDKGKTRMTTQPLPHQGLGVERYVWSSSPLRRYIDLVNQRQLIALITGTAPLYANKDETLDNVMYRFEQAYEGYNDFQRNMEKYWGLRYLLQEGITETTATLIRENLVRFEHLPLVTKAVAVPELPGGTRVTLGLRDVDPLALEITCPFVSLA